MPDARRSLLLALLTVAMSCGHTTERERFDFERMRVQQRYDLFGQSNVFANRQAMQAPVAGTVARETSGDTGVVGTGVVGGLAVNKIPIAITSQQLVDGGEKFRIYCAVCHGPAGFGGSTVAENMGAPRPPSLHSPRLVAAPPGYLFTVATRGFGRMPSYAEQLTPTERWEVVAYVEQLQRAPASSSESIDDSARAAAIQHVDSMARARGRQ